jgi:predicted nucleic acid-binding protein
VKWLLDTNVVSDSVRDRPHPAVSGWIAGVAREDAAISIVTYAELWDGATSAVDNTKRERLTEWVQVEIRQGFHDRTLPLTADILVDWLRLSRKLSARRITRDASDLLIASTARMHDLILVTRNVRDFADTGILVYDPWTGETHKMERP